jgi:prepilin-type N-terminal cleavage/methylation domain-containing protein/prepilin-type processing-associated H-X9-DG protein
MKTTNRSGFTLIELLVCVVIIAVLTAIAFPLLGSMRKKASLTREVGSARKLISGYLAYAADHDGELMPGFGNFPAKDDRGDEVLSPINYRYPWRLAPYLQYEMRAFWGNEADDRIAKAAKGPREGYIYAVSVEPALGINAFYVGGDYQSLPPDNIKVITKFGQFCVTRLGHASNASQLVVFASAAGMFNGQKMSGYFKVQAPNGVSRNWKAAYKPGGDPALQGNVDFRYDERAVVAMLDGHVQLMTYDELNDMRYWSNMAANAENRNWTLGGTDEGVGGGTVTIGDPIITLPQQHK